MALLGNKKDLSHYREIPKEEGKSTAEKYGANFWELSVANDSHAADGPLNSLIIESYLKIMKVYLVYKTIRSRNERVIYIYMWGTPHYGIMDKSLLI